MFLGALFPEMLYGLNFDLVYDLIFFCILFKHIFIVSHFPEKQLLEEGKGPSLNDNYGDTVPSRPQEIPIPNQLYTVRSSKSLHVGHAGPPGEGNHGLLF